MPKVLQRPLAEADLDDIWWYIAHDNPDAADLFLDKIEERLHQLGTQSLLISIFGVFEKQHLKEALALSGELIRQFPDNPYLDLQHAVLLIQTGSPDAASAHAERVLKKVAQKKRQYDHVVEFGSRLIIVETKLKKLQLDQAEQQLREISKQPAYRNNTLTARIFLMQGQLADLKGQRNAAIDYYRQVLEAQDRLCDKLTRQSAELYADKPYSDSSNR